jgi:hypothetical protein
MLGTVTYETVAHAKIASTALRREPRLPALKRMEVAGLRFRAKAKQAELTPTEPAKTERPSPQRGQIARQTKGRARLVSHQLNFYSWSPLNGPARHHLDFSLRPTELPATPAG